MTHEFGPSRVQFGSGIEPRCIECGYTRKLWQLSDGRWACKRRGKQFGLLSGTWLARTRFSLLEIFEFLYWFELGLTDHDIGERVEVPYHRADRFFLNLRRAIQAFEDEAIRLLDGEVEVDETYFGASFENRRADGIVYVGPVADASRAELKQALRENVSIETTVYSDTHWGLPKPGRRVRRPRDGQPPGRGVRPRAGLDQRNREGFWSYAKERLLFGITGWPTITSCPT